MPRRRASMRWRRDVLAHTPWSRKGRRAGKPFLAGRAHRDRLRAIAFLRVAAVFFAARFFVPRTAAVAFFVVPAARLRVPLAFLLVAAAFFVAAAAFVPTAIRFLAAFSTRRAAVIMRLA